MHMLTGAKLTNHHLIASNSVPRRSRGRPGRGEEICLLTDMQLVRNAENHRFEPYRHSGPWGHIYLHVFLKLLPIRFFESLIDPKLVDSRSEVSDLFLYTVAFQTHMIVFLSCVLEVEAIYIQNAFHDNISLQPSHVL